MDEDRFIQNNATKRTLPRVPFRAMKDEILGKDYSLTLNFIDSDEMRKINRESRGIDKSTDILSFPLSDTEGEIYIDLAESEIESKKFGRAFDNFIGFLFIHGLVHLKGHDHGKTMEDLEIGYRKKFGI